MCSVSFMPEAKGVSGVLELVGSLSPKFKLVNLIVTWLALAPYTSVLIICQPHLERVLLNKKNTI